MAVVTNHSTKNCKCGKCSNSLPSKKSLEYYVFTQELMDEHNQMKEDIKFLLARTKFLEGGEGF